MKKKIVLRTVFCALLSVSNLTLSSESPSVSRIGGTDSESLRGRTLSPQNHLISQPGRSHSSSQEGLLTEKRSSEPTTVYSISSIGSTTSEKKPEVLRVKITDITLVKDNIYEWVISSQHGQEERINIRKHFFLLALNPTNSKESLLGITAEGGTLSRRTLIINEVAPKARLMLNQLNEQIFSNTPDNNKSSTEPSSSYQRFFTPVLVGSIALIASILALYQLDRLPDSISQMPQNIMKFINNLRPTHLTQK